mmetsp:Transcript_101359/g.255407  ORF Transcript_101359/g.255407 Transcript_101359/m.255407 type:complete len:432 (+) Transcript_101359:306-1601(+)
MGQWHELRPPSGFPGDSQGRQASEHPTRTDTQQPGRAFGQHGLVLRCGAAAPPGPGRVRRRQDLPLGRREGRPELVLVVAMPLIPKADHAVDDKEHCARCGALVEQDLPPLDSPWPLDVRGQPDKRPSIAQTSEVQEALPRATRILRSYPPNAARPPDPLAARVEIQPKQSTLRARRHPAGARRHRGRRGRHGRRAAHGLEDVTLDIGSCLGPRSAAAQSEHVLSLVDLLLHLPRDLLRPRDARRERGAAELPLHPARLGPVNQHKCWPWAEGIGQLRTLLLWRLVEGATAFQQRHGLGDGRARAPRGRRGVRVEEEEHPGEAVAVVSVGQRRPRHAVGTQPPRLASAHDALHGLLLRHGPPQLGQQLVLHGLQRPVQVREERVDMVCVMRLQPLELCVLQAGQAQQEAVARAEAAQLLQHADKRAVEAPA